MTTLRLTFMAAAFAVVASSLPVLNAQISPEERRRAFEEAMQKIEQAEQKQAAQKLDAAQRELAARKTKDQLRNSVQAEAQRVESGSFDAASKKLQEAQTFAASAAEKVPTDVRKNFERATPPALPTAPKVAPAPAAAPKMALAPPRGDMAAPKMALAPPKGGIPIKGNGPAPGPDPGPIVEKAAKKKAETIIDADGRVIFDGSGKFGADYQVVIFEENVVVTSPDFVINGDMLTAYFKKQKAPKPAAGAPDAAAPEGGANELERAVVTGREVVVKKAAAEGEEQQIAKARKVTYFASREEVMLENWPQVQRGNNLVIAKSKDTVIILKGQEMIVKGPVRTRIERGDGGGIGPGATVKKKKSTDTRVATVIDASRGAVFNRPSRTSSKTREMFFDGNVTVASPDFDIFSNQLTAYAREGKTGGSELVKTVATGTTAKKVVVQRKAPNGEVQIGKAGRVTHIAYNDDVILEIWPEISRNGNNGAAKKRDARVVLKKNGKVDTSGMGFNLVDQSGRAINLKSNGS